MMDPADIHALGTPSLRRLAEMATNRSFSSAFNEDVLDQAPEILLLSLSDINEVLGTDYTACCIHAWGITPVAWTADGLLRPGDGLPTVDEQRQASQERRAHAESLQPEYVTDVQQVVADGQ